MTEFTWPDEAVEAVAEALGVIGREYANALPEDAAEFEEESVSAVLAALAPFVSAMLDEAREDGAAEQAVYSAVEGDGHAGRRLAEALREIRDHGRTDEFPCSGFAGGADCVDLMQELARVALAECPWKEER